MLIISILVLYFFSILIENLPQLKQYKFETKFNCYRSLMCIYFSFASFDNTANNLISGYFEPFFNNESFLEITEIFTAYLLVDIFKMILSKNTRWDLYVHHIWCLIGFVGAQYYELCGFIFSFLLINESISIVSGIDSIFMEDNEMDKSLICKKYRKYIIKYLRLPIWITVLLLILRESHNVPDFIFWYGILTSVIMIYLDTYWEKKCTNIINKHNKKHE